MSLYYFKLDQVVIFRFLFVNKDEIKIEKMV